VDANLMTLLAEQHKKAVSTGAPGPHCIICFYLSCFAARLIAETIHTSDIGDDQAFYIITSPLSAAVAFLRALGYWQASHRLEDTRLSHTHFPAVLWGDEHIIIESIPLA
jgi:fructose 1,6-bisphosphatase